jgi:hypothetical protein
VPKKKIEWEMDKGDFDGRASTLWANLDSGYEARITLARNDDGVLVCTALSLTFDEKQGIPDAPINSRFFQTLGFGEMLIEARSKYVEFGDFVREIYMTIEIEELLSDWTQLGPLGFPDEKYAAVASKYEQYVMTGLENPVSALADFLKCDKATASSRILEARKRGLLTTPKVGNFGGKLTSKGMKLLGLKPVKRKGGKGNA